MKAAQEDEREISKQRILEVEFSPWSLLETALVRLNLGPTDQTVHERGDKPTKTEEVKVETPMSDRDDSTGLRPDKNRREEATSLPSNETIPRP